MFGDSTDWAFGVYTLKRDEHLHRVYTFLTPDFTSQFRVERAAVFGQTETQLSDATNLTVGLRLERHDSDYHDVDGSKFEPNDNLWGGRVALSHLILTNTMVYGSVSRGYKSGGFNTDGTLDADLRQFDPETLYNAEIGVKGNWRDDTLVGRIALFYMWRDDMQVDTSIIQDAAGWFVGVHRIHRQRVARATTTVSKPRSHFRPTQRIELFGSLGLLSSEYRDFVNGAGQELDGRQQAQAPSYQFFVSARYNWPGGWFANAAVEGRDAYYFSDSNSFQSKPYETRPPERRSQTEQLGGDGLDAQRIRQGVRRERLLLR